MTIKVRGIEFQSNMDNAMGLQFTNLSRRRGFQSPNWPYFQDVKIERLHYTAKSGVLSLNRPGFTGGQNSRRIAHYGTDTKEEDLEAVFPRVPRTCGAAGDGTAR